VLTFGQFLLEYPTTDIRYFQGLPPASPPLSVLAVAKTFGLADIIHWKWLKNKSFTHSYDLEGDIIAMRPGDVEENWFHELGHAVYDHADKASIIPLLDRIRESCRVSRKDAPKDGFKYVQLGNWYYSYSHSGKEYEHDELFAISFAFDFGDHGQFEDGEIQSDWDAMIGRVQKEGPAHDQVKHWSTNECLSWQTFVRPVCPRRMPVAAIAVLYDN
jgi:hypothetical protein